MDSLTALMRILLYLFLTATNFAVVHAQSGWSQFAHAQFADHYIEEYLAYASLLVVDDKLARLDGQEITLSGYYIPVQEEVTILSKYPNESCFFCGDAGMETVAQINLSSPPKTPFKMDEKLTVTGTLRLNSTQWEYVSFILEDATLVERKRR